MKIILIRLLPREKYLVQASFCYTKQRGNSEHSFPHTAQWPGNKVIPLARRYVFRTITSRIHHSIYAAL